MIKLFERIFWHNNTTPAINEDNLNAMSKAIDDIDNRVIELATTVTETVPQIQEYLDQADELVEEMEQLSQNPPYIGANGDWYVWDTETGAYVDSGVDASISVDIADITMLPPGETPYVTNTGTSTDPVFHLFVPRGSGITSIAKTSTSGQVDTYTITCSDGYTSTFTVTNGNGDMNKSTYDPQNAVANAGGIKAYVDGKVDPIGTKLDNEIEVRAVNGSYNHLPYPYVNTTKSVSGASFTDNGDGTITATSDGTYGSTYIFFYTNKTRSVDLVNFLKSRGGKFRLYSHSTRRVDIDFYNGNTYISSANSSKDGSDGSLITIPSNCTGMDIYSSIAANTSVNTTIKPCITDEKDGYKEHTEYAETNVELTKKVSNLNTELANEVEARAQLGAHNLNDNKIPSRTNNGVVFTKNADGSITLSAESTTSAVAWSADNIYQYGLNRGYKTLVKKGKYIVSGADSTKSIWVYLTYENSATSSNISVYDSTGEGTEVELTEDTYVFMSLRVASGYIGTTTIKMLLSSASDASKEWAPYAKTNRELTEELSVKDITSEITLNTEKFSLANADIPLIATRTGNVIKIMGNLSVNSDVTVPNGTIILGSLPKFGAGLMSKASMKLCPVRGSVWSTTPTKYHFQTLRQDGKILNATTELASGDVIQLDWTYICID